jgi:hypothetical protein
MTFEEIQKILEQMLAVQRELQETQIAMTERARQQDRRIERLIGYSITAESDRLDLEERLAALERRMKKLEERL